MGLQPGAGGGGRVIRSKTRMCVGVGVGTDSLPPWRLHLPVPPSDLALLRQPGTLQRFPPLCRLPAAPDRGHQRSENGNGEGRRGTTKWANREDNRRSLATRSLTVVVSPFGGVAAAVHAAALATTVPFAPPAVPAGPAVAALHQARLALAVGGRHRPIEEKQGVLEV